MFETIESTLFKESFNKNELLLFLLINLCLSTLLVKILYCIEILIKRVKRFITYKRI